VCTCSQKSDTIKVTPTKKTNQGPTFIFMISVLVTDLSFYIYSTLFLFGFPSLSFSFYTFPFIWPLSIPSLFPTSLYTMLTDDSNSEKKRQNNLFSFLSNGKHHLLSSMGYNAASKKGTPFH
jgi:hypothetical protein